MAYAGEDVRCIPLNLHSATASIALLPAPQLAVDKCLIHFESRGQARKESDQSFAVRFSRCEVAQHKCSILPDAGCTLECSGSMARLANGSAALKASWLPGFVRIRANSC